MFFFQVFNFFSGSNIAKNGVKVGETVAAPKRKIEEVEQAADEVTESPKKKEKKEV